MIRYYWGLPRCGKTTFAAKHLFKLSKKRKCYANFDVIDLPNVIQFDTKLLDTMAPCNGAYVVIDESAIAYNSRKFKSFSSGAIEYFKLHGHIDNFIDVISQAYNDTDLIIRNLVAEYWHVTKFGPFSVARRWFLKEDIDDNGQPITKFYKRSPLWQLVPFQPKQYEFVFRSRYYKYFNSFSFPPRERF